jgi:hypothetical protein
MLQFTPAQQAQLDAIKQAARVRHEKARKAAAKRGRKDFPLLPFECSWAFEEQFRRQLR